MILATVMFQPADMHILQIYCVYSNKLVHYFV